MDTIIRILVCISQARQIIIILIFDQWATNIREAHIQKYRSKRETHIQKFRFKTHESCGQCNEDSDHVVGFCKHGDRVTIQHELIQETRNICMKRYIRRQ